MPSITPVTARLPGIANSRIPNGALNCGAAGTEACVPPTEPFIYIAKGAGRLPRIFQWSIGVQHEIIPNLLIEAAYVGNRGAWWTAPLLDTQAADGLTPAGLLAERQYGDTTGLNVQNPTQAALLTQPINSPGGNRASSRVWQIPTTCTEDSPATEPLLDALRPYPQWTGVPPFLGPPLGDTWYDSLQIKMTKRYSHGLTMQAAYTWAKQLTNAANSDTSYLTPEDPLINDVFNQKTHQAALRLRPAADPAVQLHLHYAEDQQFRRGQLRRQSDALVSRADWTVGGVHANMPAAC